MMKPIRFRLPRGGFNLIEVLISLIIIALVAGSLFTAFSGSKSLLTSAREISIATSLAGSYLAAANSIPAKNIEVFVPTEEAFVPESFKPENLKIQSAVAPFSRKVSVLFLDQKGSEGGPFYQVRVEVTWKRKETGHLASYFSSTLIKGDSE